MSQMAKFHSFLVAETHAIIYVCMCVDMDSMKK